MAAWPHTQTLFAGVGALALMAAPVLAQQTQPIKTGEGHTLAAGKIDVGFAAISGARRVQLKDGLTTSGEVALDGTLFKISVDDTEQVTLVRNGDNDIIGAQAGVRLGTRITVPANADGSRPTEAQIQEVLSASSNDIVSVGATANVYATTQGAGANAAAGARVGEPTEDVVRGSLPVKLNLGLFIVKIVPQAAITEGANVQANANVAFDVEWRGKVAIELGAGANAGLGLAGNLRVEVMLNPKLPAIFRAVFTFTRDEVIRPLMEASRRGFRKVGDYLKARKGPTRTSGAPRLDWEPGEPVVLSDASPASIAARFAPVIYQRVKGKMNKRSRPQNDYLRRVDYDGDWDTRNNWDNVFRDDADRRGYVYFDVKETGTHYLVTYSFYYTGRNGRRGTWAENDMGGILVVARKGARAGTEVEIVMSTKGDRLQSYVSSRADYTSRGAGPRRSRAVKNPGVKFVDELGHPQLDRERTHAQLYVTSGTHDVFAFNGRDDRFEASAFSGKGGIVYYPGGPHVAPTGPNCAVGYRLRPLSELDQVETMKGNHLQGEKGMLARNGARLPSAWWSGQSGSKRGLAGKDPAKLVSSLFGSRTGFSLTYSGTCGAADKLGSLGR